MKGRLRWAAAAMVPALYCATTPMAACNRRKQDDSQVVALPSDEVRDAAAHVPSEAPRDVELKGPPSITLPAPPFAYVLKSPGKRAAAPPPKLKKVSETRNGITDEQAWFTHHGLSLPRSAAPLESPPHTLGSVGSDAASEEGTLLATLQHPSHSIRLFTTGGFGVHRLAVCDLRGNAVARFDFDAFRLAPHTDPAERAFTDQDINWAEVAGGVLFVSTGHRTYARSSGGENAYVSALDVRTGDLHWQSAPLVSNASNFVLHDGYLFTGYGFTAEPDFVFILDASTGATVERIPVKSGPEYLFEKAGRLFVRTYNTDYVFDIL